MAYMINSVASVGEQVCWVICARYLDDLDTVTLNRTLYPKLFGTQVLDLSTSMTKKYAFADASVCNNFNVDIFFEILTFL